MYFKKINLNQLDSKTLESSLRKASLKRLSPLDIQSSVTNSKEQKKFLGYEKTDELQFTRIRYSFERILPKLIISTAKTNELAASYRVRLALISLLIISIIIMGSLYGMYQLAIGELPIENILRILLFPALFFILLKVEMRLTQKNIEKALENGKND